MSSDRFPVEVKVLGLLKHQKKKKKICLLSVLWSDQNNVLVYREFEEFKKLHKRLKRKFPIESGVLKKSDRTIPTFRDVNVTLQRNHKLSICMEGLTLLETYCRALLKTQVQISQGEDVICFFEAQSQDLDPSFPENSTVILPSEMGDNRRGGPAGHSSLRITQPLLVPTYRCIEAFETEDVRSDPFRARKEETLDVLMKDRTGWWLVENNRKQLAWFPSSYLEEAEEGSIIGETKEEGKLFYLTQAYEAKRSDELSAKAGVVVEALEKLNHGWWLVWYNGKRGFLPSAFLQPYRNPHCKFLAPAPNCLSVSTPNLSEAPGLLGKASPTGPRGCLSSDSFIRMGEENPTVRGRRRPQPLGTTAAAGSSPTAGTESSSGDSGTPGREEPLWAQTGQVKHSVYADPPQCPSSSHGGPSKPQSNARFPYPGGSCHWAPPVPPRPSRQEILRKCSAITKNAMQNGHTAHGRPNSMPFSNPLGPSASTQPRRPGLDNAGWPENPKQQWAKSWMPEDEALPKEGRWPARPH